MPKFNADEKVFEPIEITLGGKAYFINEVTQETFNLIKEISATVTDGPESVIKQVAVFLNEEPEKLRGIDLRKLSGVLKFLTETITSQIEGKTGNA